MPSIIQRPSSMLVRSPAFLHEGTIPRKYTCDGDNLSPPLAIDRAPLKTATFALIVEDPDAPSGWDHWVVCNIPGTTSRLGEGTDPIGTEGLNSWGTIGYGGPCPPEGEHRYLFRVYALDTWLRIPVRYPRALLSELMRGHVLECTTLMGRYARTSDAERAAALCHYS